MSKRSLSPSGSPEQPPTLRVPIKEGELGALDEAVDDYISDAWFARMNRPQRAPNFNDTGEQPFFACAVLESSGPAATLADKMASREVIFFEINEQLSWALEDKPVCAEMVSVALLSGDDFVAEIRGFLGPLGLDSPAMWVQELEERIAEFLIRRVQHTHSIKNRAKAARRVRAALLHGLGPVLGIRDDPHGDIIQWANP